jgi:molybdopterin-containing oxidoreductase family membrane subunit
MFDIALRSNHRDGTRLIVLTLLVGGAVAMSILRNAIGPTVATVERIMPCGFDVGQLTFLVGFAVSAVVVVLPHSLDGVREFGRLTIVGEFLAIPVVIVKRDAISGTTVRR